MVGGGYTLWQGMGFSSQWLLLLWNEKNGDIMSEEEHGGWDVFLQPFVLVIFCFIWSYRAACGILIPWPGIEPVPHAV